MKSLFKNAILVTYIILVTACSGGSSHSSSEKSTIPKQKISDDYVLNEYKQQVHKLKTINITDENNNIIKVLKFFKSPKGIFEEKFNTNNIVEQLKGINLPYSTVLALYDPKEYKDIAKIAKMIGLSTSSKDIPTQGIITYQGLSIGLKTTGSLVMTANFGERNISGLIYNRKQENVTLPNIELQKAEFNKGVFDNNAGGTREAVMFNGKTNEGYYKGAFTGSNAQEVIGYLLKEEAGNAYELFGGEKIK